MNHPNQTNRREFLCRSVVAVAASLLPTRLLLAADNPPAAKTRQMKLALMTYTFARQGWKKDGNFDLAGMCQVGRELGMDGVDIVSHSFSRLDPALVRKVLTDHGQKVVCYTFFPKINQATAAERAPGLEEVKKGVEIAHALGTDKVMIHTLGDTKMPPDVRRANLIFGLREAIPLIRAAGLTLCIESIVGSPLAKSSEMLEAISKVPGLKLVFDTGNVYGSGEEPLAFYQACKDHVVHVHFKDGRWMEETTGEGKKKRHYQTELVGDGAIDYGTILQAMKDASYSGYIDIEYVSNKYPPDVANRKAVEFLNNKMGALK